MKRFESYIKEIQLTFRLGIPIISGLASQMLVNIVTTAMVGRLGADELASAAFANSIVTLPMVFGLGMLSSVPILASEAVGANDELEALHVFRNSLVLT